MGTKNCGNGQPVLMDERTSRCTNRRIISLSNFTEQIKPESSPSALGRAGICALEAAGFAAKARPFRRLFIKHVAVI